MTVFTVLHNRGGPNDEVMAKQCRWSALRITLKGDVNVPTNRTFERSNDERALGLTQVAILSAIAAEPEKAFGTAIADRISKLIGRDISDAQVYVALARLQDRGFVDTRIDDLTMPSQRTRGRPKIYYALTAKGRRALENAGALIPSAELFVQSSSRGKHEERKRSPKPTPVVV